MDEGDLQRRAPPQELDRHLTRGFLFTHTRLSQSFANLFELASTVFGALDVLLAKGVVTKEEVAQAVSGARARLADSDFGKGLEFQLIPDQRDKYSHPESIAVNCEERVHLCRAACCCLDVLLTEQDIVEGHAAWDPGEPYFVRRRSDGFCCHIQDRNCGIYDTRPLTCRSYSCGTDERIWKDFDNNEPNVESIEALLVREQRLTMHSATPQFTVPSSELPSSSASDDEVGRDT